MTATMPRAHDSDRRNGTMTDTTDTYTQTHQCSKCGIIWNVIRDGKRYCACNFPQDFHDDSKE
tara:strand:+ start:401 stop:589 length:189 start_codon:yes stop_codon:yes gene_type:complete